MFSLLTRNIYLRPSTKNSVIVIQHSNFSVCTRSQKQKVYTSVEHALEDVKPGSSIMFGGFGLCGLPEKLIDGLVERNDINNLTVISNNAGTDNFGLGKLLKQKKITKVIASYVGENAEFEKQYLNGELTVELTPQGTLAERIRAGGAGIPAFFTPTAVGTLVQDGGIPLKYVLHNEEEDNDMNKKGQVELASDGREVQIFDGQPYVMERAITADYAIIKAQKADHEGNLIFNKSARNFNPAMCAAAKTTIVEVEEIVDTGCIDPDQVHVPGIYVDRIVLGKDYIKKIEKTVLVKKTSDSDSMLASSSAAQLRERIVKRVALEFKNGMYALSDGSPKIISNCTLPLTGNRCVNRIITEKCVFDVDPENGLTLVEIAEGVEIIDILQTTGCEFVKADDLKTMRTE